MLFLTSEDAKKKSDRDAIINTFQNDPNKDAVVLFASQIGCAGVSFSEASVLVKIDTSYKTYVEEQSNCRLVSVNKNGEASLANKEKHVYVIALNLDTLTRVFYNMLCAEVANGFEVGRQNHKDFMEKLKNGQNIADSDCLSLA